jgi:hypothetical protein
MEQQKRLHCELNWSKNEAPKYIKLMRIYISLIFVVELPSHGVRRRRPSVRRTS